jgi:Zn-dependent peptidase ImmA (M78 family)
MSRNKVTNEYKMPDSIKVGPWIYSINNMTNDTGEISGALGACNSVKKRIYIKEKINDQEAAGTLLHEVIHAVFRNTGLYQSGEIAEHEEIIVSQLEIGLLGVIRDNPDFVPYLQRLLKRGASEC